MDFENKNYKRIDLPRAHDFHLRKTMKTKKMKKEKVKVVYISSPLKVRTCASKFRALVQELTGKDSDIYELAEASNGTCLDYYDASPLQSSRESATNSNSDPDPLLVNIDDFFITGTSGLGESTCFKINFQQNLPSEICDYMVGSYGVISEF